MSKKILAGALASALMLTGCMGGNVKEDTASLPDWVMNPTIEGGIAATECVLTTGDFSLDKAEVVALGRAALAKQLEVRVKAMDETYSRKVKSEAGTVTGRTFESVSRQVADTKLQGSRAIKVDYVMIEDKKNICAMVGLDPKLTKELFDALLAQADAKLDSQSKEVMYEEFKAYKAQERLEQATAQP